MLCLGCLITLRMRKSRIALVARGYVVSRERSELEKAYFLVMAQKDLQNSLRRTTQLLRDCLAELEADSTPTPATGVARTSSTTPKTGTVSVAGASSRASSNFR